MLLRRMVTLVALTGLVGAGTALAQSGKAGGEAGATGSVQSADQTELKSQASVQADAEANARAQQQLEAIKEKGAKVAARTRARAEAKLEAAATKVNQTAEKESDAHVATRLAADFDMTADAILNEKNDLQCSWGDLMIAHALDANATAEVSAAQLVQLKQEGVGWGQIAAGLGLNLGEVVSGVNAESRVAQGLARADGKAAVIHGEGARAGVGAKAGTQTGVKAGGAKVGAGAGLGAKVGVKVGG